MVLSGVGSTLREERLRRQFSLEHVSSVTKIAARYLEAIENDRPGDLPGVVFTRGFVRQYARFLDIPDDALLSQLPRVDIENAALPEPPTKPARPFWTPRLTARVVSFSTIFLLGGAVCAAWLYYDLTPVARAAFAAASSTISERATRKASALPAAAPPSSVSITPVAQPVGEAGSASREVVPPPRQDTPTVASAASSIQVLLKARANAWVQVISDGKPAFTGVLKANDSREISGNQLVKVMTGNAGGLEISLNGRPLDPLGPSGHVKTITLTAAGPLPDLKTPVTEPDPL